MGLGNQTFILLLNENDINYIFDTYNTTPNIVVGVSGRWNVIRLSLLRLSKGLG